MMENFMSPALSQYGIASCVAHLYFGNGYDPPLGMRASNS